MVQSKPSSTCNRLGIAADIRDNQTLATASFTVASVRPVVPLTLAGINAVDTLTGDLLGDFLSGLCGNDTLTGNAGN